MTHRQIPFGKDSGLQAAFAVAVERRRPSIKLPPLLEAFGTLITRAWSHEPNTRPSMQSIVVEIMVIDAKVKADCGAALRSQPPPATTQQQPGGRPSAATTAAVPQPTAALSAQPLVATAPPTGIQPPQNGASIIAPQRTAVAPAGMAAAVSCNAQATGPPALMPSNGPGLPNKDGLMMRGRGRQRETEEILLWRAILILSRAARSVQCVHAFLHLSERHAELRWCRGERGVHTNCIHCVRERTWGCSSKDNNTTMTTTRDYNEHGELTGKSD